MENTCTKYNMPSYITIGIGITIGGVSIIFPALPAFMLTNIFQGFLITAEKPQLGLYITVAAGCTNMVFDVLFVAVLDLGLAGAAAATTVSQLVGGIILLVYSSDQAAAFCSSHASASTGSHCCVPVPTVRRSLFPTFPCRS